MQTASGTCPRTGSPSLSSTPSTAPPAPPPLPHCAGNTHTRHAYIPHRPKDLTRSSQRGEVGGTEAGHKKRVLPRWWGGEHVSVSRVSARTCAHVPAAFFVCAATNPFSSGGGSSLVTSVCILQLHYRRRTSLTQPKHLHLAAAAAAAARHPAEPLAQSAPCCAPRELIQPPPAVLHITAQSPLHPGSDILMTAVLTTQPPRFGLIMIFLFVCLDLALCLRKRCQEDPL